MGFLGALVSLLGPRVSFLVVVLVFVLLMLIVLLLLSLSVAAATAIAATAAATNNALEIDGFLRSQHVSTQYAQSEGEPTPPDIGKSNVRSFCLKWCLGIARHCYRAPAWIST